jgi:NhaP-type Na+/H+ or K+/H+ antiporter
VNREQISGRLRRLLNVESGINDGLALPIVLGLLRHRSPAGAARDLLLPIVVGIAIGVSVLWTAHRLEASRLFKAHSSYRGLAGFSLAVIVFATARLLHGNEFLAAFAAGVTAISVRPELSQEFSAFVGEAATVFKFAGVFVLGSLLSPGQVASLHASELLFVFLVLAAVRPLSLVPALWGQRLSRREWIAAAWCGPKGFASVLYAVFILQANAPAAQHLFVLAALVIATSIIAHSTTEEPVARWLAIPKGHTSPGAAPA